MTSSTRRPIGSLTVWLRACIVTFAIRLPIVRRESLDPYIWRKLTKMFRIRRIERPKALKLGAECTAYRANSQLLSLNNEAQLMHVNKYGAIIHSWKPKTRDSF